jgi:hypothetical protein
MRNATYCFIAIVASVIALAISPPAVAGSDDQAVNDTRAFIEWVFGFKLDAPTMQAIRDGTAIEMSKDPAGVQAAVQDMDNVMAWVAKHSAGERALLRSLIEPQLVAASQADTGPGSDTSKRLVAAWRAHNHIIADGTPPLRRSVVDSYIAMFEFISKHAGKTEPAGVANHDQFAKRVAAQYASASPDMQMKFNNVQTLWLATQALWAQATPAQQKALSAQWRGTAKPVAAAPKAAPPKSGLSGQTWNLKRYEEHLFVQSAGQVIMSTWSNPFAH